MRKLVARNPRPPTRERIVVQMTTVPQSLAFLVGQPSHLRQHGVNVVVVTSPGKEVSSFAQREGVSAETIPMGRRIDPIRDLISLVRLVRLFARLRPDLVHAHTPKAALLGMLAAGITRVPARIFHVHGLPVMTAQGWQRRLLLLSDRVTARLAHRVLFVSQSLLIDATDSGMCTRAQAGMLAGGSANGVDATVRFDPVRWVTESERLREELAIPSECQVVGFIGRLVRDKGVLDILASWSDISQSGSARLLLVGPREDADGLPDAAIARIESDPTISWIPWMDEPAAALGAMDVLVLPSYREGLPTSLLEAAAMGVPTVTCDLPGMRDAVQDGVTGTLIPHHDPDALAKAILTYLNDISLREAHGASARQRVIREFSPQSIREALVELYDELLCLSSPRGGAA